MSCQGIRKPGQSERTSKKEKVLAEKPGEVRDEGSRQREHFGRKLWGGVHF